MSTEPTTPANLLAFPSVARSLHQLPHATSLQGVTLHPSGMSAARHRESEQKLQKALARSSLSSASTATLTPVPASAPVPAHNRDDQLTMRSSKSKFTMS